MIKAGIIKKAEPETLTEQFIAPLFLLRIEKMSFDNTQNINEVFALSEKHVNYFWNAVKQKTGSQ